MTPSQIALGEQLGASLGRWAAGDEAPRTVTHGDYRLDNMLFGTAEGGYPLAVVDWQTPGRGAALSDASYFLGAGLLPDDRRAHEVDLLRRYHEQLQAGGVHDFSWDACWDGYRRFRVLRLHHVGGRVDGRWFERTRHRDVLGHDRTPLHARRGCRRGGVPALSGP